MGVRFLPSLTLISKLTVCNRVTSLLGESFKIHSHTLALEDDSGMTMSSSASSPSSSPDLDEDMEPEMVYSVRHLST